MNFVFVSPNFPTDFAQFCVGLKENGANVLGIGDAPYHELRDDLKWALTEYYRVDSLENYDEMIRAVGYFTGRYGKMDWIESIMSTGWNSMQLLGQILMCLPALNLTISEDFAASRG